jgi:hypothetical protein
MDEMYDDFCKEKDCMMYQTKLRINSVESPSDLLKHQKLIAESFCMRKCQYTRENFLEWMETKEPSYLAKKLFGRI